MSFRALSAEPYCSGKFGRSGAVVGREIAEHPLEVGAFNRGHPMLFRHELNDLLPSLPGKTLLRNKALGVAGDAVGIRLGRPNPRNEHAGAKRLELLRRRRFAVFLPLTGYQPNGRNENRRGYNNGAPNGPGGTFPFRPWSRLLPPPTARPSQVTLSATRCIVLLRYPLGFQSMA